MSEYRIEKVRRRVTVVLSGGVTLEGDIFLQPSARYRAGPQDPAELFNEPEPFVPLATATETVLLAKDHIAQVLIEGEESAPEIDGVTDAAVDFVLTDDSELSGEVHVEVRADRSRLLDFLNRHHERFITLRLPTGIRLVNARQIARVRDRR